jgi:ABC-type proline/glycine betaine transport system substrate-binding protein
MSDIQRRVSRFLSSIFEDTSTGEPSNSSIIDKLDENEDEEDYEDEIARENARIEADIEKDGSKLLGEDENEEDGNKGIGIIEETLEKTQLNFQHVHKATEGAWAGTTLKAYRG